MNPIRIYQLNIDPTTEQHLLSLTQRHLKLAAEHGRRQTSSDRRAEIRQEIEAIRLERDTIIDALVRSQQELRVAV